MFIVAGAAAHSSFKKAQLLTRLSSISSVQSFDSQWVYLFDQARNEQQHQSALQLLNDGESFELRQPASDEIQILVTPRVGTISPWSSKATDIFKNCNTPVHRLERGLLFTLKGVSEISNEVKQVLHDRMTETVFAQIEDAKALFSETAPKPLNSIDILVSLLPSCPTLKGKMPGKVSIVRGRNYCANSASGCQSFSGTCVCSAK